jgi:hypothetical protein
MSHHDTRPTTLAIFCKVVDNYGDIGICWRLARQFARARHRGDAVGRRPGQLPAHLAGRSPGAACSKSKA